MELQRVQFDRHPDAIRIGVIAVPGITEAAVISNREEWVMSESRRHQDVFIKGVGLVLAKFLHVTRTQDLCMHFEKLMSRVDSAVGFFRRIPEIQLEPVWPGRCCTERLLRESGARMELHIDGLILRRDA